MNPMMLEVLMVPLDREGYFFVAISAVVTFIMSLINPNLGWVFAIVTVWMAYFFRDPKRHTPTREGLVISGADGRVSAITEEEAPKELGLPKGKMTRVSVFLNIFDVHVNRIPVDGEIVASHYRPGKFLNASLDKASKDNERQSLAVKTKGGVVIPFVQIAGLVARRIRCDVKEGDKMKAGQRFGMIRFGSRVDVYLPKGVHPLVVEGQKVVAGETVLADLQSKEKARTGDVRI